MNDRKRHAEKLRLQSEPELTSFQKERRLFHKLKTERLGVTLPI